MSSASEKERAREDFENQLFLAFANYEVVDDDEENPEVRIASLLACVSTRREYVDAMC